MPAVSTECSARRTANGLTIPSSVTGTAKSAQDVFAKVYGLDVVELATNDPRRLAELPRRVFADAGALNRNVAEEILEAHRRGDGRPVLILMRDIADALTFAKMLAEVLATGPHPVEPRVVTWGRMLNGGRLYLSTAWWLTAFPGLAIFVTVLAVNLLGDHLRDWLDPRLRNTLEGDQL